MMSEDKASVLQELRKLTKGLMFQSESDYPVKAFVPTKAQRQQSVSAQDIIAAKKTAPEVAVTEVELDGMFGSAMQEQDWQSPEERQSAKRFQQLVQTLKDNLSEIKVFKVGETEADVYVIGKTKSGDLIGIKTKVVES